MSTHKGSVAEPAHRIVERASLLVASALAVAAVWRLVAATSTASQRLVLAFGALLGYLLADFISAIVHWSGDTLGDESTRFFGRGFIRHFRYHHVDEKEITRHDFVEANGNSFIATAPLFGAVHLLIPNRPGVLHFGCAVTVSSLLILLVSNHFHLWAHADHVPGWARALQRAGVILSPEHHRLHHTPPFDSNYCITAGWVDPLLERVSFFRRAERFLVAVGFGEHVHSPAGEGATQPVARASSRGPALIGGVVAPPTSGVDP